MPEWLDTTRAPPSAGMFSAPRTSTRNHFWAIGRRAASRKRSVTSASKPYSSTSKSPVTRRRRKARNSASRGSQRSPKVSTAAALNAASQSPTGMPPDGSRSRTDAGRRGSSDAGGSGSAAGGAGGGTVGSEGVSVAPAGSEAGSGRGAAFRRGRGRCGQVAGRRRRLAAPGAPAGLPTGAQRDDLGVRHVRLPSRARPGAGPRSARPSARSRRTPPLSCTSGRSRGPSASGSCRGRDRRSGSRSARPGGP